MKLYRVIDKATGLFINDKWEHEIGENEIGLDVEPAQGFFKSKWDFDKQVWIEGATPEEIALLKVPQSTQPTLEERVNGLETNAADTDEIINVLAEIVGVAL